MGSVNRVILVGNLGADAELNYTPNGSAVSTFRVATTETWKDKNGEKKEETTWHRVVLWGKPAEAVNEYLIKGKQVFVEGRIQTREYEKDGQKRWVTDIKADRVVLLGSAGAGGQRGAGRYERDHDSGPVDAPASQQVDVTEDDIPF